MPSDLKALCQTSKEMQSLATPFLYREITINTADQDEYNTFVQAMQIGGKENLKYARSLTCLDCIRRPEPYQQPDGPDPGGPFHHEKTLALIGANPREYNEQMWTNISIMVHLFPKNCLTTFR